MRPCRRRDKPRRIGRLKSPSGKGRSADRTNVRQRQAAQTLAGCRRRSGRHGGNGTQHNRRAQQHMQTTSHYFPPWFYATSVTAHFCPAALVHGLALPRRNSVATVAAPVDARAQVRWCMLAGWQEEPWKWQPRALIERVFSRRDAPPQMYLVVLYCTSRSEGGSYFKIKCIILH